MVAGTACQNSPKARHAAMSVEPKPLPNAPSAPYVHVWESPPAITEPGTTHPSSQRSVCSIPPRPWPKNVTPCASDHSFSRRWSSAERASFAGMK